METTISVIKADIGSIGGHIHPSRTLLDAVTQAVESQKGKLIIDGFVSYTGDDIAIPATHDKGADDEKIHKFAFDTFMDATEKVAKKEGPYGAGQDLLKDAFSGNVRGMGPAVSELEIEERENEPFIFFAADKTDPGEKIVDLNVLEDLYDIAKEFTIIFSTSPIDTAPTCRFTSAPPFSNIKVGTPEMPKF